MRLLLSMGLKPGGEVHAPLRPVLRSIAWPSGQILAEQRWTTPPEWTPGPEAHLEFTASTRRGDRLIQPTRTEVLWVHVPSLRILHRISHPLLSDVHHATEHPDGGVMVVSTGNDSLVHLTEDGELREHLWLEADAAIPFTERFWGVSDFRTVPFGQYKPHRHHPNFVFRTPTAWWTTCLRSQRAGPLGETGWTFPEGPPHDGVLREGLRWFTTIGGQILALDPQTGDRVETYDLTQLDPTPGLAGWCRAIDVVGDRVFVGMTSLRASRTREWARWVLHGDSGLKRPTRVIELDRSTRRIVRQIEVGNEAGGTLYALHALDA